MKTYIEIAEKKAGTQIKLAEILNVSDAYIRNAKKGRSGLPDAICIKLADYIGVDRLEVIAASNLVTEKDEERRKIFESCLSWFVVVIFASVLTVMTPSPAEASKYQDSTVQEVKTVYIMLINVLILPSFLNSCLFCIIFSRAQ
jgi:plasmid maintenance system antidote protein VapI